MEIVIKKQETITLDNVQIEGVRDLFNENKIIARVKGLDRGILLWSGEEEYAAAGNWTNQTALARVKEVLALPEIPWAF